MKSRKRAIALCLSFTLLTSFLTSCGSEREPSYSSSETVMTLLDPSQPLEDDFALLEAAQMEGPWDTFSLNRELTISVACSGEISNTIRGKIYELCVQQLEEWTEGKLCLRLYDGGMLGNDEKIVEALQAGTVDLMMSDQSTLMTMIPELSILAICGLYDSEEDYNKVLVQMTPILQPYFEAKGLHLLSLYVNGFNVVTSNQSLRTQEDLQALSIRVGMNPYDSTFWNILGCKTSTMPLSDTYINLQQGKINAAVLFWSAILDNQIYELQNHVLSTPYFPSYALVTVSTQTWENLLPEEQAALTQMFQYKMKLEASVYNVQTTQIQQQAEQAGMIIVDSLSPELQQSFDMATAALAQHLQEELGELVETYLQMSPSDP
jgi:TRAP-type C4-dicarboxylate transport system substrate-binding protein